MNHRRQVPAPDHGTRKARYHPLSTIATSGDRGEARPVYNSWLSATSVTRPGSRRQSVDIGISHSTGSRRRKDSIRITPRCPGKGGNWSAGISCRLSGPGVGATTVTLGYDADIEQFGSFRWTESSGRSIPGRRATGGRDSTSGLIYLYSSVHGQEGRDSRSRSLLSRTCSATRPPSLLLDPTMDASAPSLGRRELGNGPLAMSLHYDSLGG